MKQFCNKLLQNPPWGHNVRLLELIKNPEERLWYAEQTIVHGWSRNILVMQIETGLITGKEKP